MPKKYYYKLTTQDKNTYKNFKWEVGKWYKASGEGSLCDKGWLHFYHSADLAVLLNPIHADFQNPKLWKAECKGKSLDDKGLKIGWTEARIIEEIPLPEWTLNQKINFGILCVKEVYKGKEWNKWSDKWLNGKDRSEVKAAEAVWAAVWAAARAAAEAVWGPEIVKTGLKEGVRVKGKEEAAEAEEEAAEAAAQPENKKLDFARIIKEAKKYE